MDTKSKKSRFNGTIFMLVLATFLALFAFITGAFSVRNEFYKPFNRTSNFILTTVKNLMPAYSVGVFTPAYLTSENNEINPEYIRSVREQLDYNAANFSYIIYNRTTNDYYTNSSCLTLEEFRNQYRNDPTKSMFVEFSKTHLDVTLDGIPEYDEVYNAIRSYMGSNTFGYWQFSLPSNQQLFDQSSVTVMLAVNANDMLLPTGNYYDAHHAWQSAMVCFGAASISFGSMVVLLITVYLRRQHLLASNQRIARSLSHVWIEAKILLGAVAIIAVSVYIETPLSEFFNPSSAIFFFLFMEGAFWLFYSLCCDLYFNGTATFKTCMAASIRKSYNRYQMRYPFQTRMRRRFTQFVLGEIAFVIMSILFFIAAMSGGFPFYGEFFIFLDLFLCVGCIFAGIFLIVTAFRSYCTLISQIGEVMDHVERIKQGDYSTRLDLPAFHDLYPLSSNLNQIQWGLKDAVKKQVASERMKVELITNVSHDLKTPLTSIVNYTDLLSKENLTPDYANDYVRILSQKSNRLKTMVQDLFEISKVNSGNVELNLEKLNICELLEQTMAELDEQISASQLTFKVSGQQEPIYVNGDGKKLHRVFANLIINALKYSLAGTRVYVEITGDENFVSISFKNIAGYEMNFASEQILERFVRGDTSRSTEGSGLGLSIAQSFVGLHHGHLSVMVDGDLFKVIVKLPKLKAAENSSIKKESSLKRSDKPLSL